MDPVTITNHILRRAGFGPRFHYPHLRSPAEAIAWLFETSAKPVPLDMGGFEPLPQGALRSMTAAQRKEYQARLRKARLGMQDDVMNRYIRATHPLREKMTFFWMGHFACRPLTPVFTVKYYNHIHENALGTFSALLEAMIRDAALLHYLNNHQNRKGNPNENFARELMELFTLGRGNYTEQDVREGARALTGWGFDRDGNPKFREAQHDSGTKSFLGKKGNFTGADLAAIILGKRECALFITTKLYRFLVSEHIDQARVNQLADSFYNSGYQINELVREMLQASWFTEPIVVGGNIKSPIELLASMAADFNIKFVNPLTRFAVLRILGQNLFDPPNVAGWPRDKAWIDSSALIYRMKLPELLLMEAESVFEDKETFDAMEMTTTISGGNRKIKTTFDATDFNSHLEHMPPATAESALTHHFLAVPVPAGSMEYIRKATQNTPAANRWFKTALYLMGLPEYQLC